MLKIGTKQKRLLFEVATKGIQSKDLEFWLRIFTENCSLGFKGEIVEGDKLLVKVPPIDEVLVNYDDSKSYNAQIEIIGEGKFFMKTWEGQIQLEKSPQVRLKLEGVADEEETSKKPSLLESLNLSKNKTKTKSEEDDMPKELKEDLKKHDDELVEQGILSESSKPGLFEGKTLGLQALLSDVLEKNKK